MTKDCNKRPLRVCLDARYTDGEPGGLQQTVLGLASGFSQLEDGNEEYLFLSYPDTNEWLKPYISGPCKILEVPKAQGKFNPKINIGPVKKKSFPGPKFIYRKLKEFAGYSNIKVQVSDGIIEKAKANIMHFTSPNGFITKIPSIFQPHDLQHLHLPQFFNKNEILNREVRYRTLCDQARMVSVMTKWGKQDIIRHYGLSDEKVRIVPWAPVVTEYKVPSNDQLALISQQLSLPESFIYYTAQTWAHKNHIGHL